MDKEPKEEQVKEPSPGEEKETSEEQVPKPSGMGTVMEKFQEKKAAEAAALETPDEKKDAAPEKDDEVPAIEPEEPEAHLYLVDKDGNKTPYVLNVDGKLIKPDTVDKAITYGQVGFHGNVRNEALNAKEKELQAGANMLQTIMEKIEQSKSQPASQTPSDEEEVEEEDELEDLDPELSKTRKEVRALKEEMKMLKTKIVLDMVDVEKKRLDKDIDTLTEEKFPHAQKDDVARIMSEKDENDKFKYDLKEAVKLSHEKQEKNFNEFIEKNPQINEMNKEQKKKVVEEYLENKAKEEEAPVSPPSGAPAGDILPTPGKKEKKGFGGDVGKAWDAYFDLDAKRRAAADKH